MNTAIKLIQKVTPEIQYLVDIEFTTARTPLPMDSPLNQLNLVNGDRIVHDYLQHGESRLAYEHLQYMVDETGIKLPERVLCMLAEISSSFSN